MKQATQTFRTIEHTDGHTDIEQLFVTSFPDSDGKMITSQVWAVIQCGQKQESDMARTLNGKLTGKAAHGIDEIMVDEPSTLTAEDRARIKAGIENNYHSYNATRWASEVKVDVDKFLLAMDFIRLQEKQTSKTINLNGYKATATASWRERHLNES